MSTSFTNRGVKLQSLKQIKAYILCLYNHSIYYMIIGKLLHPLQRTTLKLLDNYKQQINKNPSIYFKQETINI